METPALSQPTSGRYARVASPIHTILVIVVLGGWSLLAKMSSDRLSASSNPNRVRLYLTAIFLEWFVFAIVVAGVRWSGASVLLDGLLFLGLLRRPTALGSRGSLRVS